MNFDLKTVARGALTVVAEVVDTAEDVGRVALRGVGTGILAVTAAVIAAPVAAVTAAYSVAKQRGV